MSGSRSIAVVGSGEMARAVVEAVRHSMVHRLAGEVQSGGAIPEGTDLIVDVTQNAGRVAALKSAAASGVSVATLPLGLTDDAARSALRSGRVVQVSPLRGFTALEAFRTDVRAGKAGKPYGIFGAHRVRQGRADRFDASGLPLLHFAFELFDEPLARIQATRASLFGSRDDAWFVIARGKRDLLITLEFAASLPASAPAPEQILFEVTGSEGVLRVEPTRQVIEVSTRGGETRDVAWWPDEAPGFVDAAVQASDTHEPARELAFLDFVAAVRQSAEEGEPVELS